MFLSNYKLYRLIKKSLYKDEWTTNAADEGFRYTRIDGFEIRFVAYGVSSNTLLRIRSEYLGRKLLNHARRTINKTVSNAWLKGVKQDALK